MSTDLKALWNREQTTPPDVAQIFARANKLKRTTKRKLWMQNIVLPFTIAVMVWVWLDARPQMITTKIGIVMVIIGIIIFLTAANQMFALLKDEAADMDSQHYLAQMIRVKQKQEFLNTTIMTVYFVLLSGGLGLYLIEYAFKGGLIFRISVYGCTFLWMGICWFYIVPKQIKRKRKAINEVIAKLEELNGQLNRGV